MSGALQAEYAISLPAGGSMAVEISSRVLSISLEVLDAADCDSANNSTPVADYFIMCP